MANRTALYIRLAGIVGGLAIGAACYLLVPDEDPFVFILVGVFAVSIAFVSASSLIQSWSRRRKAARLMAGEGLVSRWSVPTEEWERFRKFERSLGRGVGRPMYKPLPHPSGPDVEVLVGDSGFVVDGEWLWLKSMGYAHPAHVAWLATDPVCMEFCHEVGDESLSLVSFRVPVPAHALAEGRRIFELWDKRIGTDGNDDFCRRWRYDPARAA